MSYLFEDLNISSTPSEEQLILKDYDVKNELILGWYFFFQTPTQKTLGPIFNMLIHTLFLKWSI